LIEPYVLRASPLRGADTGKRRLREHGARDAAVVDRHVLAAEYPVGKGLAFADGDGRKLHAVRYVTHRVDAGTTGLRALVDEDLSVPAELDARRLQTEPVGLGAATGRDEDLIGEDRIRLALEPDFEHAVVALHHLFERAVEAVLDAARHGDLQQAVAQRLVIGRAAASPTG